FAVAAVDGGQSYWHRRADGEDRMRMLISDFLPLMRSGFGLEPRAIMGWSMGGYGALLAAERHPRRFPTVAVSSAAVWQTHAQQASAVPDPFLVNDRAFAARLPHRPAGRFVAGCHDDDFWRRMLPAQAQFVGQALAA